MLKRIEPRGRRPCASPISAAPAHAHRHRANAPAPRDANGLESPASLRCSRFAQRIAPEAPKVGTIVVRPASAAGHGPPNRSASRRRARSQRRTGLALGSMPRCAAAPRVNRIATTRLLTRPAKLEKRDEPPRSSIRPGGTHGRPCPTPKPCPSPKSLGGTPAERLGNNRSGPVAQKCRDLDLGIKPHRRFSDELTLLHVDAPDQPLELRYRGARHR